MEKRVLMVATVAATIGSFNMDNICLLQNLGYEVDIVADFEDTSVWTIERINRFKEQLEQMGVFYYQISFSRSPLKLSKHVSSYKQLYRLIKERKYSFIHTHTPIASAITRIAAHKADVKVIYTAHGFHFYDGAPLKNWLIFYPIEKFLSRYTDVLITINKEDYKRARESFHAKKTIYIPGVGVDTEKFAPTEPRRKRIRTELCISENRILLLSVGELNDNKNHAAVINAIEAIENITYVIVGKGEKMRELETLARKHGVDLRLTGFRDDVAEFYCAADVYVLPSIREGLNVSLMEAMASGLSVACGRIRGNTDLIEDDEVLFDPTNIAEIRKAIYKAITHKDEYKKRNLEKIREFDCSSVKKASFEIYMEVGLSE